jgi:hypothetical protein
LEPLLEKAINTALDREKFSLVHVSDENSCIKDIMKRHPVFFGSKKSLLIKPFKELNLNSPAPVYVETL